VERQLFGPVGKKQQQAARLLVRKERFLVSFTLKKREEKEMLRATLLLATTALLVLGLSICSTAKSSVVAVAQGPARVMVGAYYGKTMGGVVADPRWMAEHADFVEGEPATVRAFKRAGGRYGMFYTDPNKVIIARHEPYSDVPESGWLHDADGNRLSAPYGKSGLQQYILNPAAPETQAEFATTTAQAKSTGAYDFVFLDDASADLLDHLYGSRRRPVELSGDQDLQAGLKALMAHSALPVIFNGLSISTGRLGRPSVNTELLPAAAGGLAEGCFADVGRLELGPHWITDAESLLATTALGKWAFCMIGAPRGQENQARLYGYASWLLTYDPQHSIVWENLGTPSRVEIFPEQGFVPTEPLETASHIGDLEKSSLYLREFTQCYYQGNPIGGCAAAVNPTPDTVSVPNGYTRQVVLNGDGTQDGGSLSIQPGTPTTLPSGSAAILVR